MTADLLNRAIDLAANSLRKRVYAVLAGVVLLAFGTVSFWSLLFKSPSEVVYEGRMQASFCAKSGVCFARYELNIGNTGSTTQDKVVAVVHVDPAKWVVTHRVQDLAGDRPRAADPGVRHIESETDGAKRRGGLTHADTSQPQTAQSLSP